MAMKKYQRPEMEAEELTAEIVLEGSAVREEGVEVLHFGQHGCTYAAFAAAEDDCFFHAYLIFRVTMVKTARMIETIQKRTTILFSGCICFGDWMSASGFSFWKWWWSGDMRNTRTPVPVFFFVFLK